LLGCEEKFLLEVQSHNFVFLASITEAANELTEDLTAFVDIFFVENDNAINRFNCADVIDKVTFSLCLQKIRG
jgi:hypothetical protein